MKLNFFKPIKGQYADITTADDDTFSQLLFGPGFLVSPNDKHIYAPIHGKIKMIYPTHHAIAISTGDIDILIHVGLTSTLRNPEFFILHVNLNDDVKQGDLLLTLNVDFFNYTDKDLQTPIVFVQKKSLEIMCEEEQFITLNIS